MSTRCLKNPQNVPRKGWLALQPETGAVVKGLSLNGAVEAVVKYRTANNLPIEPNVRRMVEDQVCEAMEGDEACSKCRFLEEDDTKNPKHLRAWNKTKEDLWNFALAIKGVMEAAATGTTLHVGKAEATARAATCAQCEFNLPIAACWGCGAIGSAYRGLVGNLYTDKDSMLNSCGICGCDCKAQVWFTEEVLRPVSEAQGVKAAQFPAWCWKKALLSAAPQQPCE